MKKIRKIAVICFMVFLCATNVWASESEEENQKMWYGEQDALVLGTISDIEDGTYKIEVVKYLYPRGIINDTFRQLPVETLPDSILVEHLADYKISYNDKTQPEKGDCLILSVDKNEEAWKANYSPIEVSGTDYKTLEITPTDRETGESFAWLTFVKTDGKMNEFEFENSNQKLQVTGRGKFDDGKIVESVIYEKYSKDFETPAEVVYSQNRKIVPLWCVLLAGVGIIGGILFLVYKKRHNKTKE